MAAAARSILRSTARSCTSPRFTAAASIPKTRPSPFRSLKKNPFCFRSPVEMSSCLDSMLPYHTATASALLTSMLSVTPRGYGWTPEGKDQTR
ncbi:hypothetical protein Dimus_032714 [Dionaea muscipula]